MKKFTLIFLFLLWIGIPYAINIYEGNGSVIWTNPQQNVYADVITGQVIAIKHEPRAGLKLLGYEVGLIRLNNICYMRLCDADDPNNLSLCTRRIQMWNKGAIQKWIETVEEEGKIRPDIHVGFPNIFSPENYHYVSLGWSDKNRNISKILCGDENMTLVVAWVGSWFDDTLSILSIITNNASWVNYTENNLLYASGVQSLGNYLSRDLSQKIIQMETDVPYPLDPTIGSSGYIRVNTINNQSKEIIYKCFYPKRLKDYPAEYNIVYPYDNLTLSNFSLTYKELFNKTLYTNILLNVECYTPVAEDTNLNLYRDEGNFTFRVYSRHGREELGETIQYIILKIWDSITAVTGILETTMPTQIIILFRFIFDLIDIFVFGIPFIVLIYLTTKMYWRWRYVVHKGYVVKAVMIFIELSFLYCLCALYLYITLNVFLLCASRFAIASFLLQVSGYGFEIPSSITDIGSIIWDTGVLITLTAYSGSTCIGHISAIDRTMIKDITPIKALEMGLSDFQNYPLPIKIYDTIMLVFLITLSIFIFYDLIIALRKRFKSRIG